jgi:hypothetical protein
VSTALPPGSLSDSDLYNENILWSYHEGARDAEGADSDSNSESDTGEDSEEELDEMALGGDQGANWRFREGPCPRCPWWKTSRYVGPAVLLAIAGVAIVTVLLMEMFPSVQFYSVSQLGKTFEIQAGIENGRVVGNMNVYGKPKTKDGTWQWDHTQQLSALLVQIIPAGYCGLFFLYMFHCKTKFKCAALYLTVTLCALFMPWLKTNASNRYCEALFAVDSNFTATASAVPGPGRSLLRGGGGALHGLPPHQLGGVQHHPLHGLQMQHQGRASELDGGVTPPQSPVHESGYAYKPGLADTGPRGRQRQLESDGAAAADGGAAAADDGGAAAAAAAAAADEAAAAALPVAKRVSFPGLDLSSYVNCSAVLASVAGSARPFSVQAGVALMEGGGRMQVGALDARVGG